MKRALEDGLSLLAGAGIGMIAMYLLDPQTGARRRRRITRTTRQAFESAGERIAPVVGSVAAGASRVGHRVSESLGEVGSNLLESGQEYLSSAGQTISQGSSRIGQRFSRGTRTLWNDGRRRIGSRSTVGSRRPSQGMQMAPVVGGGIGLIALGAGLAWLFDPDRGGARRGWIRDKTFSLLRDLGDMSRKTGRNLSQRLYGTWAEARSGWSQRDVSDRQLEARVRSELGHCVSDMSNLTVIADAGQVTLVGSLQPDEIAPALSTARAVRGVKDVNDQLRPRHEQVPGVP